MIAYVVAVPALFTAVNVASKSFPFGESISILRIQSVAETGSGCFKSELSVLVYGPA